MRPKKVVLLVSANELRLSLRTFVLETWGYRVMTAESGSVALAILGVSMPGTVDALVTDLDLSPGLIGDADGNALARSAKQVHPDLPVLLLGEKTHGWDPLAGENLAADVFLPMGQQSSAQLLERVRVLVARRRGPKKKVTFLPDSAVRSAQVAA